MPLTHPFSSITAPTCATCPGARAGSDAHVRRAWLTCGQQQCSRARSAAHVRAAMLTCGQRCSRADSDARVRAAILACEKRCSRAGSCAPRRPNSTLRHPRRATRGGHHSAAAAGLTAVWRGWRSRAAGRQRARQGGAARGARRGAGKRAARPDQRPECACADPQPACPARQGPAARWWRTGAARGPALAAGRVRSVGLSPLARAAFPSRRETSSGLLHGR